MAGSKAWKVSGTVATIVATIAMRKVLDVSWRTATGRTPPSNPEHPDVEWHEAAAWAIASGAAIGLARMLAARKAADYWRRSTGHLPSGLEDVQV
ncbi:MAG TPA: DUF4235 domain-containing protein [Nocardioidaceae bacterium]|nr:DUF4235 domain-containing protein [Actinomycetota bacterium]MDQ3422821.1 DUF4235 domain-containing protein [Actinomycetota bacterium]HEV8056517.1 DUF4235 domain-containing protein [Nocardioidaceae bacterium]